MEREFSVPQVEIIYFEKEDIITTSNTSVELDWLDTTRSSFGL